MTALFSYTDRGQNAPARIVLSSFSFPHKGPIIIPVFRVYSNNMTKILFYFYLIIYHNTQMYGIT